MRTGLRLCLVTLALLAVWALAPPPAIGDNITGTKHDFLSVGFGLEKAPATVGLCGTCHYPHNTGVTQLIWNHTLSSNTLTFGVGATTVAGTILPTNIATAPGTTKYCLSCHDGSVAVGDMIKGPPDWGTTKITGNAMIGTSGNISGNHPVEVPYPNQTTTTYNAITSKATATDYTAEGSLTKVKLQLGNTDEGKGVTCASCHNPHDNTSTKFLRDAYATLCTNCHVK